MKTNKYGYIRVSSRDQNEDRQLIALSEVGIERKIFIYNQQHCLFKFSQ